MSVKHKVASILFISVMLSACNDDDTTGSSLTDTGPYNVGSKTVFIHDNSRTLDPVGGVDVGVATLITEIWYPVDSGDVDASSVNPTFGDYVFGDQSVHKKMMYNTTFFHALATSPDDGSSLVQEGVTQSDLDLAVTDLFNLKRASFLNMKVASSDTPFPVVIMSHGDAGSRYNMQTVCEHLASYGYVVIAPEHTGNTPFAMIGKDPALADDANHLAAMGTAMDYIDSTDGTYETDNSSYGQSYIAFQNGDFVTLDKAIIQRVNDVRSVIDKITELNISGDFAGKLDVNNIGIMGRSFGGMTTLTSLELESRLKAGVAVVPGSASDVRGIGLPLVDSATTESALLSNDLTAEPAWTALNKPTMVLNGQEDKLIIGLGALVASYTGTTTPTAENTHPALYERFANSTAPLVWTVLNNSNHGSYGYSSPYWWPELKANTFDRYQYGADPAEEYALVDADVAHDIQKTKALAFFNLFLKGDSNAKSDLISDQFAADGLILEHKNLP